MFVSMTANRVSEILVFYFSIDICITYVLLSVTEKQHHANNTNTMF